MLDVKDVRSDSRGGSVRLLGETASGQRLDVPASWASLGTTREGTFRSRESSAARGGLQECVESPERRSRADPGSADEESGGCGQPLLAGMVVCGHCGNGLQVGGGTRRPHRCPKEGGLAWHGGCLSLEGDSLDRWISWLLLEAAGSSRSGGVPPSWVWLGAEPEAVLRWHRMHLERCEHDARQTGGTCTSLDLDRHLEAFRFLFGQWEEQLQSCEQARARLEGAGAQHPQVPPRGQLRQLGERLRRAWSAPRMGLVDRKRLLAWLVDGVIVNSIDEAGGLRVVIHWRGGVADEHEIKGWDDREALVRDDPGTVDLVRWLSRYGADLRSAQVLNRQGRRTKRGRPFDEASVRRLRRRHCIPRFLAEPLDGQPATMVVSEASQEQQIPNSALRMLLRRGLVADEQQRSWTPHTVRVTDQVREQYCANPPPDYPPLIQVTRRLRVNRHETFRRIRRGEMDWRFEPVGPTTALHVQVDTDGAPLGRSAGEAVRPRRG